MRKKCDRLDDSIYYAIVGFMILWPIICYYIYQKINKLIRERQAVSRISAAVGDPSREGISFSAYNSMSLPSYNTVTLPTYAEAIKLTEIFHTSAQKTATIL